MQTDPSHHPATPVGRVHFIGIGGVSMSALALTAAAKGLVVSGSDARRSARSERLAQAGITVYYGHQASNLGAADTVVYSTDVPVDNPERRAALTEGRRLWHRSEMLAWLMTGQRALLITGTHGKTTTTAMVAAIWKAAGRHPTVLVGGETAQLQWGNAEMGSTDWVVAEADESDGSYWHYSPEALVLTNLEPEHLEHYRGSFENVKTSMARFVRRMDGEQGGVVVWGGDDPVLAQLMQDVSVPARSFALENRAADFTAHDIEFKGMGSEFMVRRLGKPHVRLSLKVPGRHNVQNALAATALADHYHVAPSIVQAALAQFLGVARRFDVRSTAQGIWVVDDYAVHPTEVAAVLATAHLVASGRILAIVQPHRYARVANLWNEMVEAMRGADQVAILPVYAPPGEPVRAEFSGERLALAARAAHPGLTVQYVPSLDDATAWAEERARPGDLVVTLGAGDVWRVADALAQQYRGQPGACGAAD